MHTPADVNRLGCGLNLMDDTADPSGLCLAISSRWMADILLSSTKQMASTQSRQRALFSPLSLSPWDRVVLLLLLLLFLIIIYFVHTSIRVCVRVRAVC